VSTPTGPTASRTTGWTWPAWLLHGNRDRCVDAPVRARAISPEHVRYSPSLHETIAILAARDARRTDSLAGLVRWAGVRI
jgi:hypothetical protein